MAIKNADLFLGDCLEIMQTIPDHSVDLILCDLPYGTTACEWDTALPFDKLWEQYRRVITQTGAIVLFGSEPFATKLRVCALDWYKYDWIWVKTRPTGFAQAKNKPLKDYENILVFSPGTTVHAGQSATRMTYNPQGLQDCNIVQSNKNKFGTIAGKRPSHKEFYTQTKTGYPRMVLSGYKLDGKAVHPTQKPVTLLEYMVRTYTNEGYIVLDNCMGSGSTGVACLRSGRHFIGIEKDPHYFQVATERMEQEQVTVCY